MAHPRWDAMRSLSDSDLRARTSRADGRSRGLYDATTLPELARSEYLEGAAALLLTGVMTVASEDEADPGGRRCLEAGDTAPPSPDGDGVATKLSTAESPLRPPLSAALSPGVAVATTRLAAGEGVTLLPPGADLRFPRPVVPMTVAFFAMTSPPVVQPASLASAVRYPPNVPSSSNSTSFVSEWASHASASCDGPSRNEDERAAIWERRVAGRGGWPRAAKAEDICCLRAGDILFSFFLARGYG
mmetsp:Transcript_23933/g.57733  ORF Transcript_23933/g.57733 Transcript_23933/m.57733 type:complete len:245 (+) Transcript_23933:1653-2387(+)